MSYLYHTDLTLQHVSMSTATVFEPTPPYTPHGPASIPVLCDGTGTWHGGGLLGTPRYNLLFLDGHVALTAQDRENWLWNLKLNKPS